MQLDAKNSPLALLAQTCSSIGREITPSRPTAPSSVDKQPLVTQPLSIKLHSPDLTIQKSSSSSSSSYADATIASNRLRPSSDVPTPDSSHGTGSRTQHPFLSSHNDEGSISNPSVSAARLEGTQSSGASHSWCMPGRNHRSGTGGEANPSYSISAFSHIKKGESFPQELVGTADDALAKYHELRTISEVPHAEPDPLQILSLLRSSLAKNMAAYSTYYHQQPRSSSSLDDFTAKFSFPDYHHVLTNKLLSSTHPASHCFGASGVGSASAITPEGKFPSSLASYLALAGAAESGAASGGGLMVPCADPFCAHCQLTFFRGPSNQVPACNAVQSKLNDVSLMSGATMFASGLPFLSPELLSASWLQSVLASIPASGMLTSYLQALAFLHPSVLAGLLEPTAQRHRKLFCGPAEGSVSGELARDGSASSSTFVCPLVGGGGGAERVGGGGDMCQRRFHSWEELLQHLRMTHHSSNSAHLDDVKCLAPRETPGYSTPLSSYATPPSSYSSASSPSSLSSALHLGVSELPGFAMRPLSPKPGLHPGYDHRRVTTNPSVLNRMIGRYHPYNSHPAASSHSPLAASKPSLSYPSALHCPSRPFLCATALS